MKHLLLTLISLLASAGGAYALSGEYVKTDFSQATASQKPNNSFPASNAIDGKKTGGMSGWNNGLLVNAEGNTTTSNPLDDGANTWTLDMGRIQSADAIAIAFEGAYATDFNIEFFSDDPAGPPDATIAVKGNSTTQFEREFESTITYRYMRLNFLAATNPAWGIKFYEVELFRNLAKVENPVISVEADNTGCATVVNGRPTPLSISIHDANGNLIGTTGNFTITSADPAITVDGTTVTASATGSYPLTITVGDTDFTAYINVVPAIAQMTNLVYSDGPWKASVTGFYPTSYNNGGVLVQVPDNFDNIVDLNNENSGGWPDNGLGSSNAIAKGDAWFTIDLARACNISAIKTVNTGAVINAYTIEFYDSDPAAAGATLLYSHDYTTTSSNNNSEEEIYLPETVNGARFVKFLVTSIFNTAYGGRFHEIAFYGPDNDELEIDRLVLSDNQLTTGSTTNLKVQAITEHGIVIYNNLEATFAGLTDAVAAGSRTDNGYPFTGLAEAIVPITFTTADPRGNGGTLSGSADLIVALPFDYHVCLASHITNSLAVAHQYNPVAPYNADNAINGVTDSSHFLAGWEADGLARTSGGELDPHANWWAVDMGRSANVEAVRITWSDNYATRYKIEVFGPETDLWNDYRTDPAAADSKALYSTIVDYSGEAGSHADLVRFDSVIKNARHIRLTVLDAANPDAGIQLHEVCLAGRDNPGYTIESLALVRKDVSVGETRACAIYGLSDNGYTIGALKEASIKAGNAAAADGHSGEIAIAQNGRITGVKKGIAPAALSWSGITTETFVEVTTADWSKSVNIARTYRTSAPSTISKNGFTLGNPLAKVWSSGIAGAENESVSGLIDGDWMSWTITDEETRAADKPYVVIDLGAVFPVNEFNIHWQADGDGEGNGSYILLSGNYRVYGSADNNTWTDIYTVENRPAGTYFTDRHAFDTAQYRYLKFEFTAPKVYGQNISINEITVGGPEFYNADNNTFTDYPGTYVLQVATPGFDRSNVNDRQTDNNWIVTSTNVNKENPLNLSYLAVDCYGRSYLPEGAEVNLYKVNADGSLGQALAHSGKTRHYRNINWPVYVYTPSEIGSETITARIAGTESQPVTEPLTIYTISDCGNVNRYAYAYDNAVNYNPGTTDGDRDFSYLGTAPQNAADGNYGSWYAIGYYGDGDHMGQTYKYPAGTILERPYELTIDYRGMSHDANTAADRFVKELDMIGIQFEGAYARDYNVYLLHCDDNGAVAPDAQWEKAATFINLQHMGVGQTETQRIYPAGDDGMPLLDADGRIIPWKNVAAIKVEMLTTGTQWGIKMMESAIYGKLNKTLLPLAAEQARYKTYDGYTATAPAKDGTFVSFDLALSTPFAEEDYVSSELTALAHELPAVKSYIITLEMRGYDGEEWLATPFTPGLQPDGVLYADADGNELTADGTITDGGLYSFTVPADSEHMVSGIIVRNVDPSKAYRVMATPLDADGNVLTTVAVDASPLADLTVPSATFIPTTLGVDAIASEIANRSELRTADGAAMSLGSCEDGRRSYYNKVNEAVINGYFRQLGVTASVTAHWNIRFDTGFDIDGMHHTYTTGFTPGSLTGNTDIAARLRYVPLHTIVREAAELAPELDELAPDHIRSIPFHTLDTDAAITVNPVNTVTYTLGEKEGPSHTASLAEAAVLPQATLGGIFAAPEITGTEKKVFPIAWNWNPSQSNDPYDAMLHHGFNLNSTANVFAGFHAANEVHARAVNASEPGIVHGGIPLHSADDLLGTNFYIPDYDEASNNFGDASVKNGWMSLRLQNVKEPDPDNNLTEVAPIYTLLAAEYPLALCNVEASADGDATARVSSDARPVLAVSGGTTSYGGSTAEMADGSDSDESAVHLQLISVPVAVRTVIDVEKDLTSISAAAAGTGSSLVVYPNPAETEVTVSAGTPLGAVEIFTLNGSLVSATETGQTSATVNVSDLSTGVYIVRAAGLTSRLLKR